MWRPKLPYHIPDFTGTQKHLKGKAGLWSQKIWANLCFEKRLAAWTWGMLLASLSLCFVTEQLHLVLYSIWLTFVPFILECGDALTRPVDLPMGENVPVCVPHGSLPAQILPGPDPKPPFPPLPPKGLPDRILSPPQGRTESFRYSRHSLNCT